ncbi:hypothetical protein CBM2597_A90001 [Cupriavidus taiwanensis]|nr:hypothetical protein CBM2597_A90001 [Cupriavidus taiwanensis]
MRPLARRISIQRRIDDTDTPCATSDIERFGIRFGIDRELFHARGGGEAGRMLQQCPADAPAHVVRHDPQMLKRPARHRVRRADCTEPGDPSIDFGNVGEGLRDICTRDRQVFAPRFELGGGVWPVRLSLERYGCEYGGVGFEAASDVHGRMRKNRARGGHDRLILQAPVRLGDEAFPVFPMFTPLLEGVAPRPFQWTGKSAGGSAVWRPWTNSDI